MFGLFAASNVRDNWSKLDSFSVQLGPDNYVLDLGRTYLVCEKKASKVLRIAQDFVLSGSDLLCISRTHPELLSEGWGDRRCEYYWLSERTGPQNIAPDQLSRILQRISAFMIGKKNAVVLLEGIEYLCLFNDFTRVQMFVEQVNDLVMSSQAVLLLPIDPQSLDQRSMARLRRYAEVVV